MSRDCLGLTDSRKQNSRQGALWGQHPRQRQDIHSNITLGKELPLVRFRSDSGSCELSMPREKGVVIGQIQR